MQETKIRAIRLTINEARSQLKKPDPNQNKYPAIVQTLLDEELNRELTKLEAMLAEPKTFESKLKERCSKRSHDYKKSIPMRYMVDTPANKLYWKLVEQVFQPQSMHKMFAIMLPDIKSQFNLYKPKGAPQLASMPLDLKKEACNFDHLTHYVITDDSLLDMRITSSLDEAERTRFQNQLTTNFPAMRQGMDEHEGIRQLLSGCKAEAVPAPPATPRAAIMRLILKYKNGSQSVTVRDYAPESTLLAVSEFLAFLDTLSSEMQLKIRAISDGKVTLDSVLCHDIFKGECAEKTSKKLDQFITFNPAPHDILDAMVGAKTANNEAPIHVNFLDIPSVLAVRFLPSFGGVNLREVAAFLAELPATFYSNLIKRNKYFDFEPLFAFLSDSYFNREQIHAFLLSIVHHIPSYKRSDTLMKWVLQFNDHSLLQSMLQEYTEDDIIFAASYYHTDDQLRLMLNALSESNRYQLMLKPKFGNKWNVMLAYITDYAAFMRVLSQSNPSSICMQLVLQILNDGAKDNPDCAVKLVSEVSKDLSRTLLSHPTDDWLMSIDDIFVLQAAVSHISKKEENQFFLSPDENGNTIFHVSNGATVIEYFLNRLPANQREAALTTPNKHGESPLQRTNFSEKVISKEAFEKMVLGIPKNKRYKLFSAAADSGVSLVYQHAENPQRLGCLMLALPQAVRLKSVISACSDLLPAPWGGQRVKGLTNATYHAATTHDALALHTLLSTLHPEKRLPALVGNGEVELYQCSILPLRKSFAHLNVALSLLPKPDAEKLLMHPVNKNNDPLIFGLDVNQLNEETARSTLDYLSPDSLTTLFSTSNVKGNDFYLRFVNNFLNLLQYALGRIPENKRTSIVKPLLVRINNHNVSITTNIINLLPKHEQLEIIQRLMQLNVLYTAGLKGLIELRMPDERLAAIQANLPNDPALTTQIDWNKCGSSVLEASIVSKDAILTLLDSIPQKQRPDLLHARLKNGDTVIQAIFKMYGVDAVTQIPKWIVRLNDEQGCEFLQTRVGNETLLQRYAKATALYMYKEIRWNIFYRTKISDFSEWQITFRRQHLSDTNLFMHDLLVITAYLHSEDQRSRESQGCWRFFYANEAGNLLSQLYQCKTIDEYKLTLMAHFEKPDGVYRSKIVPKLANQTVAQSRSDPEGMKNLELRWGMEQVKARVHAVAKVMNK